MAWISSVAARSLRHLTQLDIELGSQDALERRHLVLVGANGSGKSSLLKAMSDELEHAVAGRTHPAAELDQTAQLELRMAHLSRPVQLDWTMGGTTLAEAFNQGELVLAYLPTREPVGTSPSTPPLEVDPAPPTLSVASRFTSLLASRREEESLARRSGDAERAKKHEGWRIGVQFALRRLLHQPHLTLLHEGAGLFLDFPDGRRMRLDELASGHAAATSIWAEIFVRVEAARRRAENPELDPAGVVLIDAAEMHLDARSAHDLLPTLAELFPRVQLIATTHSPLVAMSLENATVFDLVERTRRPTEDIRGEGYEALLDTMLGKELTYETVSEATMPLGDVPETRVLSADLGRTTLPGGGAFDDEDTSP